MILLNACLRKGDLSKLWVSDHWWNDHVVMCHTPGGIGSHADVTGVTGVMHGPIPCVLGHMHSG